MKQARHVGKVRGLTVLAQQLERYRLSFVREEKVGPREAVTLKVATKGMPDVLLSFDRKSWLVVKDEYCSSLFFLASSRVETTYSRFKKIEGCQIPMKWVIVREDSKSEKEILECKHLEKINERLFRKP